jgi:AraC family transcriptional regulator
MHRFPGDIPGIHAQRALAKRASPFGSLYDGWLNVERSMLHAMDEYITEGMLAFPGGWVETRQIRWSTPVESTFATTDRCYMLTLLLSGRQTGARVTASRAFRQHDGEAMGRMMLVPPDQTLKIKSIEGQSRSIRCMLDAEMFEAFLADTPRWREDPDALHAALHIGGGQIEWLLRRMHRELRQPDFATSQVVEALAKQLTGEIVRALKPEGKVAAQHVGGMAPWRLRLIRQRLWSEAPLPNLEELAGLCDMTVRHLSRAFRSETGYTLGKHVEEAMVDRATAMLGAGKTVRDVAAALGYATSGSFTAAFRRATGLVPSEVGASGRSATDERGHISA